MEISAKERAKWPKDVLVALEKPFVDERGVIQNLVDLDMKSAVLITSKKGAVRANHYHKTDWHYCYMVTGKMEYFERPTGSDEKPKLIVAQEGQMLFTPPMVDHAMKFLEDTIWVTLSRNPRNQKDYEADVVRIKLI
jgi:dTDP-4-dehydrorhamnose 3,5-epimerase-like enzyme